MVLQANKRKSKIIVEESDVCHKFMSGCVQYILPLNERKFVNLMHVVDSDDFVIFLSYDKKAQKAQKSDLHRNHWAVHCPLVEEAINQPNELFHDCIVITFTVEQVKKK